MGERDKETICINCTRCGSPIEIKWGSYRRSPDHNHLCWKCRGDDRHAAWEKLSPEEKEAFYKRRSKLTSDGYKNMSKEKYNKMIESRKKYWESNPERKERQRKEMKEVWANRSKEEKDRIMKLSNEGKERYWTPEMRAYHSQRAKKLWESHDEETRNKILKSALESYAKYIATLSKEERELMSAAKSSRMKKWWANLPEDKREEHFKAVRKALKIKYDLINITPNKNEKSLIEILDKNFIKFEFQYYNKTKHPDFDKLFPYNPYRSGGTIPYHAWDFILYLNKPILVDIDGSIHCKEKSSNIVHSGEIGFVLYEYIHFKDMQRPYQTDGFDAYVIQCYDDNLTDDTPVMNIGTNKVQTFKDFITMIKSLNTIKNQV